MGHATVSDMMEDFKKAHNGLDILTTLCSCQSKLGISWGARKISEVREP